MNMLLRDISFIELAKMLQQHPQCSSAPQLVDPRAIARARRTAKRNGVWDRLTRELDPAREIPVRKRSVFRNFSRNGNRSKHLAVEAARSHELEQAALALWLKHPKADLDYLQDLLWAYCDDWTWIMAAHEKMSVVDLGSAIKAARFAEILFALEDQIEAEVKERVRAEIEKRVLRPVWDYDNTEKWHTARMNWNHVCNGGFIRAALLLIKDPAILARAIHPVIQNMTYALDGFPNDGGCEEGAGYWGFGFGHFVQAAYALHCRTNGELNLMADPKVERICRFPLAAHISGTMRATFADSHHGHISTDTALQINHFHNIPELYELCRREDPETTAGPGRLLANDMHTLALYAGQKAAGTPDQKDYHLPDLGLVKLRGQPGPSQITVLAIAGNNGVPHNHNDIGSFLVHKHDRMALTDPGAPLYNNKTFGGERYAIIFCRSRGHSVPLINGTEQAAGPQYRGTLSVTGINGSGTKRAEIDMTRAYPAHTVTQLIRTLELDPASNQLTLTDAYTFPQKPKALEEAFVTFEKVTLAKRGDHVRLGPARGGVTLTARQPGTFEVETLVERPEHVPPGTPPIHRIRFLPANLSKTMTLQFHLA
ncbi:MAG: heparinase II/III family protein [Verrucomicrobia bacterium]|nr:heparinase II/III family protein [Verrucomicrobiota bacterium]MCH8529075.1 heparinase II/III-family protein [Kiritimatiellia bacterium]